MASLARIFREAGVARLEPKKKPRSAWRRFVYPAPNACWQLDATEYVLTGGRRCVIFQLIDDHSRYAVASHVAAGETAKDAIAVFDKAVAAHGVPQRLLTDNGRALNPSRLGIIGQLVAHVAAAGRRGDHRQAVQADHPGQERTLPPDPVPLPRQAAAGRVAGRTPGPGRRLRPHLQHPAPPPRATRADHAADRLGGDPQGRSAPPEAGPARLPPPAPVRRPRPKPPADLPADTRIRKISLSAPSTSTRCSTRSTSTARSSRSSSSATATRPATRSSSPTSTARSSPSTPDPDPASATSATADHPDHAPRNRDRHRSPDTTTVTDVLMQNCHPCPETSQRVSGHAPSLSNICSNHKPRGLRG